VLTIIVSGSYPALVMSSFQPANILKGTIDFSGGRRGSVIFRKVLVSTQFTISILLIVGTIVVANQISFMRNTNLGYENDYLIYFIKRGNIRAQFDAFKNELLNDPGVLAVTASSDIPTYTVHSSSGVSWEGMAEDFNLMIHQFTIDKDYLKTMDIALLEGRNFFPESSEKPNSEFILNETAVKMMNLDEPIGKMFNLWNNRGEIIGVIKDFHYKSLHEPIEPLVMRIDPGNDSYVIARINADNIENTIEHIENTVLSFNPEFPFQFTFVDDELNRLYDAERRTGKVFNYFAVIAILISCLGIYGLAAYTAQQRTKEIGVRKVLGASMRIILYMLSKEYLILITVANVIGWPVAWYAMNRWLDNFAYRIEVGWLVFVLSGLAALLIALFAASFQSIRAARANPVDSLRYE
ncbi:FtsX-like permease family protein, partial [candidate division KSB1 bacterium]